MSSLAAFLRDYVKNNYSVPEIVDRYVSWVTDDKYMILSKWNKEQWKNDLFAVKCAKRGNDVYRSRVYRRFRGMMREAEDLVFFNPRARGAKATRALWITLTYDTKLCPFKDAWENIGTEFNGFMAFIRKQFGKISSCRVFESFENGYPHIHCILLFESNFPVFQDAKGQFRIHEKDAFAKAWHSNVDVKAMSSLAGGFAYLKKYLLKGIDFENADSKGLKTLAMCWTFRKRAFSVSGSFRKALNDLISLLHNSNVHTVQVSLLGDILPEEKVSVLGFVPISIVGLEQDVWFAVLNSEQICSVDQFLSESKRGNW